MKIKRQQEISLLPFVLFCITSILLHEEIALLVQIVTSNIQCLAESLEMNDFPFSQETKRSQYGRVIGQVDKVFISRPCFLFCCTFVSVTCYVKKMSC